MKIWEDISTLVWGKGVGTNSETGTLLVNKFSREIHFSNKSFKSSHQNMSWKVAEATNFYLQKKLIFSKVANLLCHNYILKVFLVFRNTSFWLFPKIRGVSRTAATSKMERFVIIVRGWKPLTIITKRSILDIAAVLDPSLEIQNQIK